MAVTVTPVLAGTTTHIADVEATADADTQAVITHGLGAAPLDVTLTPIQDAAAAPGAAARISDWVIAVGGITSTTITVVKTTGVGSGTNGPQLRVKASLPHTLVQ